MSRILILTKNYPPAICGVGDHSFHLKQEWEKLGHQVFIFTTSAGSNSPDVYRCEQSFFSAAMDTQMRQLIAAKKIDTLFWQYVPYSYQQKGLPFWWPVIIKKFKQAGLEQAIFFHEVSLRLSGDGVRQGALAFFQRRIANKALQIAGKGFTSIPLYQSYFKPAVPDLIPISSNLPVAGQPGHFVAGRIVCFANRADKALLDAVQEMRQQMEAELWLCGSVSEKQKNAITSWLQTKEQNKWLRVCGEMSAPDLATLIGSAQVFIQPQVTDASGRGGISAKNGTVMAAMSMARPIITCYGDMTDPKLFRNEENMLFVPYGDPLAYKEALLRLLADSQLAQQLGAAAAATYYAHCSWEITAGKLAAAFSIPAILPSSEGWPQAGVGGTR
jgi:glycosyltransferase involved in cell wall biosynthesis